MFKSKTTGYVSEMDKFLTEFNRTHALTPSQKEEIKKHQRVYRLRNKAASQTGQPLIWEKF